ncbi:putative dynein heavy chain 9 axonemal [Scophthalmus maximus]|uniref:Dynein axonemal heavy chain 17 n=1 Tax=Scophthalmus maximus TaxID=52904 RepID=A0A2U9CN14_SCOMX|nr:putative dynein heavy chain 9 axonemal [Scophthalmus maximus]
MEELPDDDRRLLFIADVVLGTLKLKQDKWQKCVSAAENREVLQEFLEKPERRSLVVFVTGAGLLQAAAAFSAASKSKGVFFVKPSSAPLGADCMEENLVYGDMCYAQLEQCSTLVQDMAPLLFHSSNHTEWPPALSQEIGRHVHSVKTHVFVVSGQVQGKTLLPLPAGSEKVELAALEMEKGGEIVDKGDIIHSLESGVIEWSHQICAVLKKDSSEALREGKNPTPHTELLFWKNRYTDLECIHSQLKSSKVNNMAKLLEAVESSYSPAFTNMQQDILAALKEAKDICTYLNPLQRLFEDIESADFPEIRGQIGPLMHTVCLVWANSSYYNTPQRLIVLLQETCNLLIQQALVFLVPEEILTGEMAESLLKVRTTVEILQLFKGTYEDRRANLSQYQREGSLVLPWDFSPLLVFSRIDCFVNRLKAIEDILLTAVDILKLEKLEIGGIRGRELSQQVELLYQEFVDIFKLFTEKPYDCLDLINREFEEDVREFKLKVDDTERRLGAIFCQAFEDASGLEHVFKVMDMFGGLLERPLVAADALDRYPLLVSAFDKELDDCKLLYDRYIQRTEELGSTPVSKNMPLVAGGLRWIQELQERIQNPFSKFGNISFPCLESAKGAKVIKKYEELMQLLDRYSASLYETWTEAVDESSQFNLSLPLISRDPATALISVNFSPQLVSVLREVKYLEARQTEAIPETAVQIYTTRKQLWEYVANLELAVSRYNKVMDSVLDVEHPLVQGDLRDIDAQLKKAEKSLNWNSQGIWEYIQEVRDSVCDLESRLHRTTDNVEEIKSCMRSWAHPMFVRKDDKHDALLCLVDRAERLESFYGLIRSSGEKIHFLLKSNLELFRAEPSSEMWMAYVDYIDDMIIDGFFNSINCSLKFFLDNTDEESVVAPLFEAQLGLQVPDMVFTPSLEFGVKGSFSELVDSLITDVFRMSSLMPRLAQHSPFPHYLDDMEDMADLDEMVALLKKRVRTIMTTCCEFRDSLEPYSYLYVDDRKEFMRQFLLYGHVLTTEEIEVYGDDGVPESPPTLDNFKEQVDRYEKIYEEAQGLEPVHVFQRWMRVDGRSMKSALLNIIKKWSFMFIQHLIDHVTHSLSDLEKFISVADAGLAKKVEEGDYGGLVGLMGHLLALKERQSSTDAMFEPLQQTIALLKVYDQKLPDVVHKQLTELPEKWDHVKKHAVIVKQQVAPLQATEVASLRRKCASFDVEQHTFREHFRKNGPFRFESESPFQLLDEFHLQIQEREAVMATLVESANLFEVTISEYKQLRQCRREVGLLKELWDMITVVEANMAAWRTTPWREIQVEDLELECKRLSKDIRSLDKEVRGWEAYTGLDSKVKNLLTSLRAVAELQNPAIRARHWNQLMAATGVCFTMDKETTLADLLQLNLHSFEEEVREIVDKAVKEMGMEKVLSELNTTWTGMQFQYEPHHRTQVPLLRTDEELIETLEDNQVQLQNLMSSKYIAHFLDEVSSWQSKLSVADSVIALWFDVQRTWTHLESIFIGSEDIRSQLPEDSKRFEEIDTDFKEMAGNVHETPNVVEATNKPGLIEKLEGMQSRLSLCEKALAEYLDTKRLAFPRFYFVSSVDLLDILSNGTNPHQVQKHLSKLFDNMAKMEFEADGEGNPSKIALGMYSKEDEYVPFNQPCDCTGQVEMWLNRVLDTMRATVRHEMTEAVVAYEEKPREQWLFDYPAQVALTCTQIWWTSDVGMAFARLEEGYDNAMKECYKKQVTQLNTLISMLIGQLTTGDRQKIMTICTIDVHARDVVAKMITQKLDNSQAFLWLSQLRNRWGEEEGHCFSNICDAQFIYSYEYLGNTPRLVITPLTDRCYITLTQSLHLIMSGAPAGPAGTGKTETTKDLGRALGIMVYVFNCSEQMDYKSCGDIYKGLAQTGAWGCFDEFNRISVEVLSVVAVQVKSIQDAIRDKKTRFNFMGEDVNLSSSVGIFITMNPGYAGRTELPENLKALFRPCAMVVPDFELICEIMLVAEGFLSARVLARKFITLYTLCKELLSKQDHYDWGLRAIKSVLVVAGSLKRGDPGRAEDQVLMRALRDFNIPKIVTDDMPVFMGLIGDLFPALDVPRKRDFDFEQHVKESILDLRLQAEDNFVLKVVQMEELLAVRHSVFVIGNAGTGKSQVMRSLQRTYQNMKRKPVWADLNPKSVTNDELFGIINPSTREWKDGLFSCIMRDMAIVSHSGPKWIVLDGDIDPMWIESLNTVMDDNKVLTLASNERIPLNPTMRLVFEISHLRTATPATVSRAGILYINPADLGWNPPVLSWIDKREVQSEKANLALLFDKYLPPCLDVLRSRFKKIIPIPEQSMVQMLCYLLECLLTPENTPPDCAKELYELYFVFAAVWAFGGAMFQDQLVDYRVEFSKWWVTEFKNIKFPVHGTVFDYYIDPETHKFEPWSKMVPKFVMNADTPLQACLVHTTETIRVRYFMDRLLEHRRPVMLVGNAGNGKSVLVGDKLGSLDQDKYVIKNVPFNYYTTSAMLQAFHFPLSAQGILFCTAECLKVPPDLLKIYLHESNRVYRDKLLEEQDFQAFDKLQRDTVKKFYEDMDETLEQTKQMNMYCHFSQGQGEPRYLAVESWSTLNKTLLEVLDNYNDVNATLNLVLFEDAMAHICRVNRILESPRGNALLVGVGGSGKQSLTRLAAFISNLEVFQITLRKGYGIPDLKADLAALYMKAGVKNIGTVLLMTDAQVSDEKFLVLVNDLLASGEIPDLFPDDEMETIIGNMRAEVRASGLMDSRENCWKFFIDRVRRQLKVALCFSPVGNKLRVRSRKFPAVVNCTAIDWFHEWPQEALESVSFRFLEETENIDPQVKESVSKFMAYVHMNVNQTSKEYLVNERRYNYTTPKSFLEQIKLYQSLLGQKSKDLTTKTERLENGLQKLNSTSAQVDDLKAKLAAQEVVGVETDKVSKEKAVADEEEQKVAVFAVEVTGKQRDCERDLAKAEPALLAAQGALDTLNKNNLTELKSFGSPVLAVTNVTAAVMVLMAPRGKVPKDRSWKAAKAMMAKVDAFLDALVNFKKENIPEACLKAIQPYLNDPEFEPELVASKSLAAAGLCSWVVNIVKFYEVYCEVEPKRQALSKANADLAAAQEKLATIKSKITVGGLASEKVRWAEAVENFKIQERTLCGDVLLITAFISYLGYFTKRYRLQLMDDTWRPYLSQLQVPIPVTADLDPLTMLTDDADIAVWQNEGLPADRMSTENATILTSCQRWPLMVDPQLQGIKWIKNRYSENLLSNLTKQQNSFKITLKTLEDNLLSRLSSASGNFLGDTELVENLETTKCTAAEIEQQVKVAKVTEANINEAREHYRLAAARASLLYFIMNDLDKIHPMYQFSLKAFSVVFESAVRKAEPDEDLKQRVLNLIDNITSSVFQYTTRGLFECDKLTYIAQLAFQILVMNKEINPAELDFLLRYPVQPGLTSPVDFLSHHSWGGIKALSTMEEFGHLDRDIEGSAASWKKFVDSKCPEKEKFPQEWKNKNSLQKLCMMRALRPDRMTYAIRQFVEEKLGTKYVAGRSLDFAVSFEESGPATPMFFILSPGVDPLKDVEKHGKKLAFTFDNQNFHNVSLGQGQEIIAEQAINLAAEHGHWVILQNIHLVSRWLGNLEKLLEQHAEGSNKDFRLFVSAEPSSTREGHIIPQGILENSIKITNEPPTGMHANLHKALDNFNQDTLEMCSKESEFKSILFSLCYFHAVVAERRKFGPQGWNRSYPFNTGDLTISINVLYNYLEANPKVPYDDLRYLFGEIMYGGHITDDWDRRLCRTYLEEYIKPEMMDGELFLAPDFPLPGNLDYNAYHQYIDETIPPESPYLYGLHPNAEIGFLTQTSEKLFRTVLEMQPRDGGAGEGGGATREEKVRVMLEDIMERLPEEFNMVELLEKAEERTPYQVVALQECERMNFLTQEMRRSLRELNLGLKGELTMTTDMESLQNAIFLDTVPDNWTKLAYPSMSTMALWFTDLLVRIKELEAWSTDFALPSVVWLAGFFNPQSFLTAIMQAMARRNEWPLDSMGLQSDVTKRHREEFTSPPREGAYIHGLYMEGARWDTQSGMIVDALLKELTPTMPVMFIRAIPVDKQENRNVYQCPVYKTRERGPTYVWTFNLKTKDNPSKWALAGVALLLQI